MTTLRVAHLAPHLGGGVGSVIQAVLSAASDLSHSLCFHSVFCLDRLHNKPNDLPVYVALKDSMWTKQTELNKSLKDFDVVLCHYWNHPLLASYLALNDLPSMNIIFWFHNSGLSEPHVIPNYILDSGAPIIFTTPASVDAANIRPRLNKRQGLFHIIPSTRFLGRYLEVGRERLCQEFSRRLLYVGTVSETKMHRDSAIIFSQLSKHGFNIDVVGGDEHNLLENNVKALGGMVKTYGWVDKVLDFYASGEIFVYPLRSGHYGTGEQVILEAMAAGLPVVVFDNPAEKAIVSHGETGFIARSVEEFISYVKTIATDREVYASMSKNAVSRVEEIFDSSLMTKNLIELLGVQSFRPKVKIVSPMPNFIGEDDIGLKLFEAHSFFEPSTGADIDLPSELYSDSLLRRIINDLNSPESRGQWISRTKGSPFHYLQFFPDSKGLDMFCGLITDCLHNIKVSSIPQ